MAGKTCVICGAPSGMYPLCVNHLKMKNEGKVIKCKTCGSWHETSQPCKCKPQDSASLPHEEAEMNKVVIINQNNKSKCITCGKQTDGVLFCGSCYHKYKSKDLLFRIKNCSSVELLDESYEGKHVCQDGHIVKSIAEMTIDDYLYNHNIAHAYESTVRYGPNEKDILHADFCLPNYLGEGKDVYLEHWGFNENNKDYTKTKKFKIEKYKQKGVTLICTFQDADMSNPSERLAWKLNKEYIKENEINFDN